MEYRRSPSDSTGSGGCGNYRIVSEFPPPDKDSSRASEQPKHEEWNTSKKITNHTTRQVETRVKRQIVVEDGKVIWDTGPQVTTRTTEDTVTEDQESTEHKSGDFVAEKTDTRTTSRLTKEENAELEDDPRWQLPADAYHHLSVTKADFPRGRLTHYDSHSKQVIDRDIERSVSTENDGHIDTETTHTHHHEEIDDDEVPETEYNRVIIPEASVESTRTYEVSTSDSFCAPDDVVETSKTKAGGNIINIQMETSRKPNILHNKRAPNSQLIYVKGPSNFPSTRDSGTQTPPLCTLPRARANCADRNEFSSEDRQKTINRFVSALDRNYDDYPSPPSPSRLPSPYHIRRYNSSSSASSPDSLSEFRNYVADDYRQWIPPNSRKWTCSDGTVVVAVRHRDRRKQNYYNDYGYK